MKKVLLIDDESLTHTLVKSAVKSDLEVISAFHLDEARALLQNETGFEAILIDRMLPDGDGLSLCGEIRANEKIQHLPIIFISAKNSESDKVSSFYAGADDYITKPFSPLELKARILSKLRNVFKKLTMADISVDMDSQIVNSLKTKESIILTRIEFKILVTLMQSPGRIFSRSHLLDKIWGASVHTSDRVVDTHVSHLRRKIKEYGVILEALRGEGYRLTAKIKT